MYAKELREKLARLANDMRAIVDTAKNDGNRGLASEEREKFHALEADYSGIEDSIKLAEKSDSILDSLKTVDPSTITKNNIEQLRDEFDVNPVRAAREKSPKDKAFSKYMRSGIASLTADEVKLMGQPIQNTMSTGTGSQGGYVIPQGFSKMLEEAKLWFGGIDGVVGKFTTETGNTLPWPTLNDTTNKGRIIGQNVQVTQTDPVFGSVSFSAYIGSSDLVLIPLALIQDAYFDMDALIARLLGTRLGRLYNNKCTVGTGTNEPTGIVTAATTAGSIFTMPTGQTATLTYNSLVDIEHTVDPAYRFNPGVRWMFNDTTLKVIKKLVDGSNRPLWQPGLTASFRDGAAVDLIAAKPTILDHPYVINQDMASPAANAYSVVFGDLSTFMVREVAGGTTVLRLVERYADYLQVGFIGFQRFDSQLLDAGSHPIALGRNSAT